MQPSCGVDVLQDFDGECALRLCLLALRDILHGCQAIERPAASVFHQPCKQVDPDRAAVLSHVALVRLIMVDFALGQPLREFQVLVQVVRMGELRKTHPRQLLAAVAGDSAERVIDAEQPVVRGYERVADWRLVEGQAEPFFALAQRFLRSFVFADVDDDSPKTDRDAVAEDRRGVAGDREQAAILALRRVFGVRQLLARQDSLEVVSCSIELVASQYLEAIHARLDVRPRIAEHLQRLSIDESNPAVSVGLIDRLRKEFRKVAILLLAIAQALLGLVLVEGQFDDRSQLTVLERLDDVAERFGRLGPFHRFVPLHHRQEDDGDVKLFSDRPGGADAVYLPRQLDIHEHQFGPQLGGERDRLLSPGSLADGLIAESRQMPGDAIGREGVVFDDQDSRLAHNPTLYSRPPEVQTHATLATVDESVG